MHQTFSFQPMLPSEQLPVEDMILNLYSSDGKEPPVGRSREQKQLTLQRALTDPENLRVDVLKANDQVAGYALLYRFWSNEYGGIVLTLDELYILPAFRNRNMASIYINTLEEKETSCVVLALEVMPGNDKAKALYERLGFKENRRTFMNKKIVNNDQYSR